MQPTAIYPVRNDRILRLIDDGKTFAQVAKAMNLSRSTVAGVAYRSKRWMGARRT